MAGLSNYVEAKVLDCIFNQTTFTAPAAIYLSLHTADPGETGANEMPNAESYARVNVTNSFAAASGGSLTSDVEVLLAEAGGDGWAAATHVGFWDSGTHGAGNFLWGGALTASKTAGVGVAIRFPSGQISASLD